MVNDSSSSFMGELKGLALALNNAMSLIQGRPVVLRTDSQSVSKRLTGTSTKPKKRMNKRVSKLLAWLWSNYISSQLSIRFVPGLENGLAVVMSRWGVRHGSRIVKGVNEDDLEVSAVTFATWEKFHEGHVGLSTMLHREKTVQSSFTLKEIESMLGQFKVSQRHAAVR